MGEKQNNGGVSPSVSELKITPRKCPTGCGKFSVPWNVFCPDHQIFIRELRTHYRKGNLKAILDSRNTWIYFVEAVGANAVKVGRSRDVPLRMSGLGADNHCELLFLECVEAPPAMEQVIHASLSDYRIRGEWFRKNEHLAKMIELAKADAAEEIYLYCEKLLDK